MRTRLRETARFQWMTGLAVLVVGCALDWTAAAEKPSGTKYDGFVLVRGGSFQMGDAWGDSPWAMPEVPVHEVELGDFLLGKREVTVGEFGRFADATGHKTQAETAAGSEANRGFLKDGKQFYPSWRAHWFKQ